MFISDSLRLIITISSLTPTVVVGIIFNRCDLAKILRYDHHLSNKEIAIWVCIAQRQSGFNSAAITYDNDGTAYHGLFQISDKYWCHRRDRKLLTANTISDINACEIDCDRLRNNDLSDDFQCIRRIYDEHSRISGDGYMAWAAYKNNCRNVRESVIEDCFSNSDKNNNNKEFKKSIKPSKTNKIYHKCELARELRYVHKIPRNQINIWTCIVKHESNYNTSAIGRLNADGSGDHGLFQISDIYWCSADKGLACGLTCKQLEDDDITDDVECIKIIYEEHQRLSGDGFNAWSVYQPYCKGKSFGYTDECFKDAEEKQEENSVIPHHHHKPAIIAPNVDFIRRPEQPSVSTKGKIYKRCELARELYFRHKIPMEQIATWVCIAQHESNFNTSAIGRLNADGSEDHGLFQISDIYWCSPPNKGWVCGVTCAQLEDSDITDDVKCMKMIYDEHQRLSGNGFNAWAVYQPYCKGGSKNVNDCFDKTNDKNNIKTTSTLPHKPGIIAPSKPPTHQQKAVNGKIYNQCELATELRYKHNMPINEISTWVCIAKFESNFNTSAIGRLNADGSEDHGLFQISDIYWCSPPNKGHGCGLTCAQLEDSDITDDIECVKLIYDEHTRLSGDGFNAWTVYKPHCKGKSKKFITECFTDIGDDDINTKPNHIVKTNVQIDEIGKIYDRCELAIELRYNHNIPLNQIAKWVCIAFHESAFNTSAVTLGDSSEHGIFQISDAFWCSPPGNGFACGLTCAELEDSDISDDVKCVQQIYEEHQRLSGDGFNAWQVYQPYCRQSADSFIRGCFDDNSVVSKEKTDVAAVNLVTKSLVPKEKFTKLIKEKIVERCDLARDLRYKYDIGIKQIPIWVCIIKHQSQFNTSAVKKYADGFSHYGLFQIGERYWCSPPGFGCNLSCEKLIDSNIDDDVECAKHIYQAHKLIDGDGFKAWSAYDEFCKDRSYYYVTDCFDPSINTIQTTTIKSKFYEKPTTKLSTLKPNIFTTKSIEEPNKTRISSKNNSIRQKTSFPPKVVRNSTTKLFTSTTHQRQTTNSITANQQSIATTTEKFNSISTLTPTTVISPTTTTVLKNVTTSAITMPTTEIDYDQLGHLPIKLPGKRVYRNLFDFYLNGFTKPTITTYPWTSFRSKQQSSKNVATFSKIIESDKNINTKIQKTSKVPNNSKLFQQSVYGGRSSTKMPFTPSFIQKYIKN